VTVTEYEFYKEKATLALKKCQCCPNCKNFEKQRSKLAKKAKKLHDLRAKVKELKEDVNGILL
jgi:hypothetical protein